ncbi:hypothetical protein AN216_25475 [Streptomyces oceani]|uniref:Membrane associated protein n=2 Tax=Streptomyces oceani TaxID=1075402 RepID=A0A1E7JMP4_9ACTN|nr:hypothetical protein AN216_25475 [Streptomyces oceani]
MPQQPPGRSSTVGEARPDASMSLLTNVMEHSLDDGYAEAADRAEREGSSGLPRSLRAKLWLAVGLALTAVVVTVSAVQARVDAPVVAKERAELVDRVEEGTREADELEKRNESLRTKVSKMQHDALRRHGGEKGTLVALLAGATRVEGPGIKLTVDDAADSTSGGTEGPRDDGFADQGRIRDRDMQRIVNGLWAAGAEAVAINGHRLTALSAIRAAGDAILVNNKPLGPPYTVLAVGDGAKLDDEFRKSAGGKYLQVLKNEYGVRYGVTAQDELRLPASSGLSVRTAEPVRAGKGSTS